MIEIVSFGFGRGPRPRADVVCDCRRLPNPHDVPGLRPRDGRSAQVKDWLLGHDAVTRYIDEQARRVAQRAACGDVAVAVGCSAGRHRSVVVAEALAEQLAGEHTVLLRHAALGAAAAKRTAGRGKTSERGLGWRHQQQRDRLLKGHVDGAPCWWCGAPMFRDGSANPDGKPLAADHEQSRRDGGALATRLLHSSCNAARGAGDRDDARPAARAAGRVVAPRRLAMAWPT
ncbi:RapZ C-terminal domain-containing protein [Tomitella cavernea]|uniref:RapZ C-terminal domain-containing protein n=1 Tax=Tomitella cavernea TaxID=1387982 RepID=A0ABP9CKH3_9ACTN|nr:RNase adapter RapZ [Tomitella cavernea]